ncbi:MAG: hypothetical protein KJZ65_04995 [Phycisphaerales bacterium]|nr:hypothetical protein [Phycisphaerales bacterium]
MALFGKKKDETADGESLPPDDASVAAGNGDADGHSPEKAAKFFEPAKIRHESGNYEYAAQLWLQGLAWDPTDLQAVKDFWQTVQRFAETQKRKSPSKEMLKAASEAKGPLRRFLTDLLNASFRWEDPLAVLKAAEAAADVESIAVADLYATRAYGLARLDKKPRKDVFVRLMRVFSRTGNFKLAVESGETARQLDPSDGELQADVRNMMAQQTMSAGGFDQAGQSGGFRKNIRDAQRQAELEASDRLVRTEEEKERLVEAAKRDLDANPDDPTLIDRYGQELLKRNKPGDLIRAMNHYAQAYQRTKQYRFRQKSGEIQLRLMRQNLARQQKLAEQNPDDLDVKSKLESMKKELDRVETDELRGRVENYPTDLAAKFELGKKLFEIGAYDESIALFQAAQDDPKNRGQVLAYMGRAFQQLEGWENEAIQTLRNAIDMLPDSKSDLGLELRYDLMLALYAKARRERERSSAEEADQLAAGIAMQRFNYRDIRERRAAIKALLDELRD